MGNFSRSRGLRQQEPSRGLRQAATSFLVLVGMGLDTHHCCPLFTHWHCWLEVASSGRVCGEICLLLAMSCFTDCPAGVTVVPSYFFGCVLLVALPRE